MTKMILLKVGRMDEYRGLDGDRIQGSGSFVGDTGYGHEMFNFLPWHGRLYGYAPCRSIDVRRLGARPSADGVTGVLVVWVACHPHQGGSYIVGWYDNATVHNKKIEPTWALNRLMGRYVAPNIPTKPGDINRRAFYLVEADEENCQLIPVDSRSFSDSAAR